MSSSASIIVLAHNEARRISICLDAITLDAPATPIHVVVNGSSDGTADIARAHHNPLVQVHEYSQAGKSRSWNRFILEELVEYSDCVVFVDGDAEILPGSIRVLAKTLEDDPYINLAAGMPRNGRNARRYQENMRREHGVFGDLYALRGEFLERMRLSGIRLPNDLIGDDGLIGALAKTNLLHEEHWDNNRVATCESAGFLCEPVQITSPRTLRMQYRRMINYSLRYFQDLIISEIMRSKGPHALPRSLSEMYAEWLGKFRPRRDPRVWWFDREALIRIRQASR